MASPRAFLSFDYDHDLIPKNLFAGQAKTDSPTPFTVEDWSSKSSLPQRTWEAKIKAKISKCHMLIVLVGRHMGSATGVAKEIRMAKDNNVPYLGVYVDGAGRTSTLPKGLPRSRTIRWDWDKIAESVGKAVKEGKNKDVKSRLK